MYSTGLVCSKTCHISFDTTHSELPFIGRIAGKCVFTEACIVAFMESTQLILIIPAGSRTLLLL